MIGHVFEATTKATPLAKQQPETPVSAATVIAQLDTQPPPMVGGHHTALQASATAAPALATACSTTIGASAGASPSRSGGQSDVRIFALRSLLTGLSQDAATAAERAHFARLLDLVNA